MSYHLILGGFAFLEALHLLIGYRGAGGVVQLLGDATDLRTTAQHCQGQDCGGRIFFFMRGFP